MLDLEILKEENKDLNEKVKMDLKTKIKDKVTKAVDGM